MTETELSQKQQNMVDSDVAIASNRLPYITLIAGEKDSGIQMR